MFDPTVGPQHGVEVPETPAAGRKYDKHKRRMDLVPTVFSRASTSFPFPVGGSYNVQDLIHVLDLWRSNPLDPLPLETAVSVLAELHPGGFPMQRAAAMVDGVADVLTFGARKYADNNWQKVDNAVPRYYAALRRHLNDHIKGEAIDPESGCTHLSCVGANVAFILAFLKGFDPPL